MTPSEVYEVLAHVGATKLHHANTVLTSCTYLENGALLSRGYVERHGLKQTPQASDDIDKKYGIWDAVFLDHVDIHYRGGRKKGPNQYGPVLFVLTLEVLRQLPAGTEVRVTRANPVHWRDNQKEADRWFLTPSALQQSLSYGDFDKMLVISTPTGKVDFPERTVRLELDDPRRAMAAGPDAYGHAVQRLTAAAQKGQVTVDISQHRCQSSCLCLARYSGYDAAYFDSRFA